MISPLFGLSGTDSATAERFTPLSTYLSPSPTATESVQRVVMPDSGTISNFFVKRNAPGAGTSVTYTLVKNGINSALTCTLSDPATTASDITNAITYVAGDVFSLSIKPTGTVTVAAAKWSFENSSTGQALLMSESTNLAAGTYYGSMQSGTWQAANTDQQSLIPTGGTIDRAYIDLSTTTGASKTWTATLVKNGTDTALVASVTGGTQGNDTTHSVSVVAGDTVYWRLDATNTPASTRVRVSARFTPTTDGESIQMGSSTANLATTGANYAGVQGGSNAYSATEGARADWLGSAFDVKKLYVAVDVAPGAAASGKLWTATIRSNAGNTAVTCQIVETATSNNDTTHTATPTTGALLGLNIQGTSTPTASPAQWGYVTYRAPTTTNASHTMMMGVGL